MFLSLSVAVFVGEKGFRSLYNPHTHTLIQKCRHITECKCTLVECPPMLIGIYYFNVSAELVDRFSPDVSTARKLEPGLFSLTQLKKVLYSLIRLILFSFLQKRKKHLKGQ